MKTATTKILLWLTLIKLAFTCTNDFGNLLPTSFAEQENSIVLNRQPLDPSIQFSLEFSESDNKDFDGFVDNQLLDFTSDWFLKAFGNKEQNTDPERLKKFLQSLGSAAVFQYELPNNARRPYDAKQQNPFYLKCVKNCKGNDGAYVFKTGEKLTLNSIKSTKFTSRGNNELISNDKIRETVDQKNGDSTLLLKDWGMASNKPRWRQFCLKKPPQKTDVTCNEFPLENVESTSYDDGIKTPYQYLTIATYKCKSGYGFSTTKGLQTEESVMCVNENGKGSWKSVDVKKDLKLIQWKEPETCKPKSCEHIAFEVAKAKHAKIVYKENYSVFTENGSTASVTCDDGYFFNNKNKTGDIICDHGKWDEWTCEKGCNIHEFLGMEKQVENIESNCTDGVCKKGETATMHCKIHDEIEMKHFQEINPKIPDGYKIQKFVTEDLKNSGQTKCEETGWKNICTQKVLIKNSANDKPDKVAL